MMDSASESEQRFTLQKPANMTSLSPKSKQNLIITSIFSRED